MAIRRLIYASYAVLALLVCLPQAIADDIWSIDIDLMPAPSPEDGPPFSAHAIRDTAYLPYQILGIVGSYFVVILFIGTLLLSCGQRARKRAQMMASTENGIELVKRAPNHWDPSPLVQQGNNWYSPGRLKSKKSATTSVKSIRSADSIASFDAGIVEGDKQKRAQEMEKLYAAVMAQDDRKSQTDAARPPQYTQRAPGLDHLRQEQVRAIYPNSQYASPLSPSAISRAEQYQRSTYSSQSSEPLASPQSLHSSPSKRSRKSLKNIKISAPIHDNDDGLRTPLSPRVYIDPGTPPEPPTSRTVDTTFEERAWPTTPGTARTFDPEYEYDYDHGEEEDEIQDLPQQRTRSKGRQNFSQPLRIDPPNAAASVNNVLPFRQLHWNSPNSPMYPYQGQGPFSAGPTKTTFVEARRDRLGAPLTGMITPYSAYMPFTPLTPVTAKLQTREERKQREKEQRALHGAITEEDQVVDDKELWDSGY